MGDECEATEKNEDTPEWSDEECAKISQKDFFPSSVKDRDIQKRVISRFLNFYLGARNIKGIGVPDLVFAVLSIMPPSLYKDEILWDNSLFREDGTLFHLTPEDKLAADIKKYVKEPVKPHSQENVTSDSPELSTTSAKNNAEDKRMTWKPLIEDKAGHTLPLKDDITVDDSKIRAILKEFRINGTLAELGLSILNETDNREDQQDNVLNNSNVNGDASDTSPSNEHFLKSIKFDPKPVQQENKIITYGPAENSAFNSWCSRLLDSWHEEAARAVLKSFFAVVALVLMRATAKGYKHIFSTFHSERFLRLLRHIKINDSSMKYSPPHKRCLKGAYRAFCRKDNNTPIMFAKLVLLSEVKIEKYLNYILRNGLLNYTADYGYNLVNLWRSIHTEVGNIEKLKYIVELTTCAETESSWEKLSKFLAKYKSSTSKEVMYRWARVLDPRFFKDISCQANYELAVLLAVFAEKIVGNTGIWDSTWVNKDELDTFKKLGEQLYEQYLLSI